MTAATNELEPLEWRMSVIRRPDELDPVETAVEEALALRHDIADHDLAVRLLLGVRPDLGVVRVEHAIDRLLQLAAVCRSTEIEGSYAGYDAATDEYAHMLGSFARGHRGPFRRTTAYTFPGW